MVAVQKAGEIATHAFENAIRDKNMIIDLTSVIPGNAEGQKLRCTERRERGGFCCISFPTPG